MLKKLLITGILISILLVSSGCTGANPGEQSAPSEGPEDEVTLTASPTSTASPTETPEPTVTATALPTETSTPTEKPFYEAGDVTGDFAGQSIAVCGEVTDYGQEACPDCKYGFFAYLILDDNFYIISYDWTFDYDWVGASFVVKDTVETMGSKPIFVYGGSEGWDGSECVIEDDGGRSCVAGDYFKFVLSCHY
jgi:hypothetical protein